MKKGVLHVLHVSLTSGRHLLCRKGWAALQREVGHLLLPLCEINKSKEKGNKDSSLLLFSLLISLENNKNVEMMTLMFMICRVWQTRTPRQSERMWTGRWRYLCVPGRPGAARHRFMSRNKDRRCGISFSRRDSINTPRSTRCTFRDSSHLPQHIFKQVYTFNCNITLTSLAHKLHTNILPTLHRWWTLPYVIEKEAGDMITTLFNTRLCHKLFVVQ